MQLSKQVLAAALSIESDEKVLKTLSINLILYRRDASDSLASIQGIDLSAAKADGAYWADCDFSYADFYSATLSRSSFRRSKLTGAQFREAKAAATIFNDADCTETNFKMADLRGASFENAILDRTNFENAKVYSASLAGSKISSLPSCMVDLSEQGDGSRLVAIEQWLISSSEPL
jgi:uncharacterized protein YjbI with pentapeptide repeats